MRQKLNPFIDESGERRDNYYVDSRTDILYFKKGHGGKKIKFSTGFTSNNFVKAQRYANKEFDFRIGKKKKISTSSLIKDELELWVRVKETEGLAYDTLNNVRRAKRQIAAFWGEKFPSEIGQDSLAEWYVWWKANHPKIDMENAVKYMRNFCGYLAQKIVNGRPLLPIVPDISDPDYKKIRRRRKKKKERIFSASDLKVLIKTAESELHQLIILIMYTMATRITETLTMSFDSEIFLRDNPPRYRWSDGQNKADHDGWHALHPTLIPRLTQLRVQRFSEGTKRLFPQQADNFAALKEQQIDWAAWRKRAALGWHWTPHTFRHTCLSNLFNDPKNPQAIICKLYRVSLATAMETYIKPTAEGIERLREAIEVRL